LRRLKKAKEALSNLVHRELLELFIYDVIAEAIIIRWGRSYVQKQMACTNLHIEILGYKKDIDNDNIIFIYRITGNINISINDLVFKVTLKDGSQVMCYKGGSGLTKCDA